MDPISVAAVVALIATFVEKVAGRATEQVAEDVGNDFADRIRQLFETVKTRFSGESYAAGALERFEAEPGNERRRTTLEDALSEIVDSDPAFEKELEGFLTDARKDAPTGSTWVSESGAVSLHGDIRQAGRYVAGRDMSIGTPDPE